MLLNCRRLCGSQCLADATARPDTISWCRCALSVVKTKSQRYGNTPEARPLLLRRVRTAAIASCMRSEVTKVCLFFFSETESFPMKFSRSVAANIQNCPARMPPASSQQPDFATMDSDQTRVSYVSWTRTESLAVRHGPPRARGVASRAPHPGCGLESLESLT